MGNGMNKVVDGLYLGNIRGELHRVQHLEDLIRATQRISSGEIGGSTGFSLITLSQNSVDGFLLLLETSSVCSQTLGKQWTLWVQNSSRVNSPSAPGSAMACGAECVQRSPPEQEQMLERRRRLLNIDEFSFCAVSDGDTEDSENRESLSRNGITHILSVCNNARPVLEGRSFSKRSEEHSGVEEELMLTCVCSLHQDMTYLCIDAADASRQNLSQHFRESIRFIHECRLDGGACLVHCLAGVSRSTTLLVAYLMTVTSFGWEDCLSAVKAVRSFVGPNDGFQQQLQEFQTEQLSEYRAWLQATFRPSPFQDQEQVEALLKLFSQQQEQSGRSDPDWMGPAHHFYPVSRNRFSASDGSG
ncbi:hypothetical protein DNTS_003977 [Danionella cerebrum]|uniref:Protein-tyrosine-phosphatase n=1 Tax=Danionella cerebrum TaxID=2873325 RepID=A0A553PZC3_9TELE|nr:hypothetical protein DNTS_003977 [Danionella translucida]